MTNDGLIIGWLGGIVPREILDIILDFRGDMFHVELYEECVHYSRVYEKLFYYYLNMDNMIEKYFMGIYRKIFNIGFSQISEYEDVLYSFLKSRNNDVEKIEIQRVQIVNLKDRIRGLLNYEFLYSSRELLYFIRLNLPKVDNMDLKNLIDIFISEITELENISHIFRIYKMSKLKYHRHLLLKSGSYVKQWSFRIRNYLDSQLPSHMIHKLIKYENDPTIFNDLKIEKG